MILNSRTKGLARPKTTPILKKTSLKPEKLGWHDFCGCVDPNSRFHAHTYWKIRYTYTVKCYSQRALIDVDLRCFFDKKTSWTKPEFQSDELLNHEQGHYNIGCLCALTFKKRVQETVFSPNNYRNELTQLFRTTLDEFLEFEKRYDAETDHFKNKAQQKEWDDMITQRINELSCYW